MKGYTTKSVLDEMRKDSDFYLGRAPGRHNIGFPTGYNGYLVVDVDCKDKDTGKIIESCFDYVEQLFDECPLGEMVHVVQTRSGGYHIYLRVRSEELLDCSAGGSKIDTEKRVDIIMKGAYVVYPPSHVREDGKAGEYKHLDYIPDCLQFDVYEAAAMPDTVTLFAEDCPEIMKLIKSDGR